MIVYGVHINRNTWKFIVWGDNRNSQIKGEPSCQSLFFTNFSRPQKTTGILGKANPLNSLRAGMLLSLF